MESTNHALNESSRRIKTDDIQANLGVNLMPHQKAMVYKILDIESHVVGTPNAFAMMSDKPGAGKTYAILAAIYISNVIVYQKRRLNVIVVPYNIFTQWHESMQRIYTHDSRIRTKSISQYADILDAPKTIQEGVDILLTTSLYFNSISGILKMNGLICHRVFFDEADTIAELLQTPLETEMTWFVSASMESVFQPQKPKVQIGKYQIDIDHLRKYNCVCDPDFVNTYIVLPPPETHVLTIANAHADFFFQQAQLYGRPLDQIAAMDWSPNKYGIEPFPFDTEETAFETLLVDTTIGAEMMQKEKTRLEKELSDAERAGYKTDTIRNKLIEVTTELSRCNILASAAAEVIVPPNKPQQSKLHVLENIIKARSQQTNASIIVFTNYDRIYKWIRCFLEGNRISYKDLDGGNIASMDKTIGAYKRGEFTVLLADSSMYSCGMNLENTTDIVFVHALSVHKEKQVIGRAHRYGRTSHLHIWKVYYAREQL